MRKSALDVLFDHVGDNRLNPDEKVLFINGRPHQALKEIFRNIVVVQTSAKISEKLKASGIQSTPHIPDEKFGSIFFLGTKYKEYNIEVFRYALTNLVPGGTFLCAMENEIGAGRFERELKALSGLDTFSDSKSKCRVFGVTIPVDFVSPNFNSLKEKIFDSEFQSHSASFSAHEIDAASNLLVGNLTADLIGLGLDLGAGYGYLSFEILKRHSSVSRMDLVEDDYNSVEAAKINLNQFTTRHNVIWSDVASFRALSPYDFVITNPPYHQGHKFSAALGEQFIEKGLSCLKPGGRLFAVNLKTLPYMKFASGLGATTSEIVTDNRFVVWSLTKEQRL